MIDEQKLVNIFNNFTSKSGYQDLSTTTFKLFLFTELFNSIPNIIRLNHLSKDTINESKSAKNFIENTKFDRIINIGSNRIYITKNLIVSYYYDIIMDRCEYCEIYHNLDNSFIDKLKTYIVKDNSKKFINYVTYSSTGFTTRTLNVNKIETDLSLNYNDDLPDEKIKSILNSDSSGLIVLHGIPGSGKTTYLRHLIYNIDKTFLFIDQSCFGSITDSSFIQLLSDYQNSIVIIEDCESLLQDRSSGNSLLSGLLNLSDGILGDSLNLKFICTFNSNLNQIDKAILRKGRLKLKYEFKALTPNKVEKLCKSLNKTIPSKDTPVCDIYNLEDNGGNIKHNKIGF